MDSNKTFLLFNDVVFVTITEENQVIIVAVVLILITVIRHLSISNLSL